MMTKIIDGLQPTSDGLQPTQEIDRAPKRHPFLNGHLLAVASAWRYLNAPRSSVEATRSVWRCWSGGEGRGRSGAQPNPKGAAPLRPLRPHLEVQFDYFRHHCTYRKFLNSDHLVRPFYKWSTGLPGDRDPFSYRTSGTARLDPTMAPPPSPTVPEVRYENGSLGIV